MHGLKKPIQGKIGRARKNLLCSGGSKSQRTAAPSMSASFQEAPHFFEVSRGNAK